MTTLGERLREARNNAGLTQYQLASAIGVSDAAIGHWERGIRTPSIEEVQSIAQITMTDPAELILLDVTPRGISAETPDEIQLLKTFRILSERQRQNLIKLLQASAVVRQQIEGSR